ncbi:MAG: beta-ketoacyl-[acyl-carrier-protein] synthase family protein [Candidatus Rokubacteria bacterium]|nr:beta-ketoacyl-[acyl-carrier-protein] synthase family protein [Candidatus Rokubacteria bacterium]
MKRRVVITGLGAVTPVGIGVKAFWQALRDGVSGLDTITLFDASAYACRVAAEVKGFEARDFMSPKRAVTIGRFAQLGVAAARLAYDDAALSAASRAARFAVCFGSSANAACEVQDGVDQFLQRGVRGISPSAMLESAGHAVTGHVSVELGLKGQTMTLASGCSTGIDVVQWGYHQIESGLVTGVLAGATEAPLSTYTHAAFSALGVLSNWPGPPAQALRPFDALSDGLVLGEGAGAFVLEDLDHARARGARIYAEVLGFGSASEGVDLRTVDPAGGALQAAARAALRMARLDCTAIDYVNAHGNGLPDYDRAETAAYRALFGRHAYNVPVSSIKPVTGQSLAAAGALQVVAGCFALEEQFVPPTLNHDIPQPECDLDYVPNRGRVARVSQLLIAAHAMGGTHSALILGRSPDG